MTGIFLLELDDTSQLVGTLEELADLLKGAKFKDALGDATALVASSARDNVPYWRGDLRASIEEAVGELVVYSGDAGLVAGDMAGAVFTTVPWAPVHERGHEPYFPNLDNITEWAEGHGMTAYELALIISEKGIKELKFFEEALVENEAEIVAILGIAIGEVVEGSWSVIG